VKVLLVDADAKAAHAVARGLRESGFVVDLAEHAETALLLAGASDYDLIVTEVTFPDRDGWEVARELRRSGNQAPLFIVTSRGAVKDRVRGLELGADDYLVKPFAFSELLARAHSILRRARRPQPELLRIADLEINLLRRRVTRAGRHVALTRKEFELLLSLARRAGQVVPQTRLIEEVWDMNYRVESNTLAVHMHRLRSKIDGPGKRRLIRVERGLGYQLLDK
jgi:two-component system copper resistance phosphate regulon response regulator CusR